MAAPKHANIKEKILSATVDLLFSSSFESISTAAIAKQAGISKGTLFYYFECKDDILTEICERQLKYLENDLIAWLDDESKDTRAERLIGYILERGSGSYLGNLRLYLICSAVSGHEELRKKYNELYCKFQSTILEALSTRLNVDDSDYLAWLVITATDGLLIQRQLDNKSINADKFINETISFFCKCSSTVSTSNYAPIKKDRTGRSSIKTI